MNLKCFPELTGTGLHGFRSWIVNGETLNFLAIYISSILESLIFLGPGC